MEPEIKVRREYKDTVFRMIYRTKKELLVLYNALNGTSYNNPDELETYTLDNAIYMNVKNDISILLDSVLTLYEQQSTVNPNMPLRDLIYVTRQFEKYIRNKSIYSSKLIRLPVPKFIVFYNGISKQPDRWILKLSDAYLKETVDPELELKVTMININPGHNQELMNKCRTLKEYSMYVDRVRQHAKRLPIEDAVRRSVDECISEGILTDFLTAQKAEVIAMSIFEYNEETELKKIREDEYDLGLEDGKKIGLEDGRKIGLEDGRKIGLEDGRKIGLEDGKKLGIKALTETCRDLGLSKEETAARLTAKFSLSAQSAAEYIEKFW